MSSSILIGKKFSSQWWLHLFLSIVWAKPLIGYARGIILRIPFIGEFTDYIEYLFYVIPLICALPTIIQKIRFSDLFFYFTWLLIVFISYLSMGNTTKLEESAFTFLFSIIPLYFVGRLIDINKLLRSYYLISIVCILAGIFYMGFFVKNKLSNASFGENNMGAAYSMLPYLLFIIASIFRKFSLFILLLSIIAAVFMISLGTRGPLVCITVFVLLIVFFSTNVKHKNTIVVSIGLAATLGYIYMSEIMRWLLGVFMKVDLSTRVIDKFLAGDITNDSGRGDLQGALWNLLERDDNPFGYGLFSSWNYIGTYPHNFLLDIFFSFGYILGGVILICFIILFLKALKKSRYEERAFLLVLFCSSFVKLLLSGTFVFEPYLFLLIGYSVTIVYKRDGVCKNRCLTT